MPAEEEGSCRRQGVGHTREESVPSQSGPAAHTVTAQPEEAHISPSKCENLFKVHAFIRPFVLHHERAFADSVWPTPRGGEGVMRQICH